jgi:hypothetical protein
LVEFSMTWLLVNTSPSELITMPVPAAASLLYFSVVLMTTRPGSTLLTTSCTSTVPVVPPLDGDVAGGGTALAPGRDVVVVLAAGWSTARVTPTPAPAGLRHHG